jgi:hypothetical protein
MTITRKRSRCLPTRTFDPQRDNGEDVFSQPDLQTAQRTALTAQRVNADFSSWMARSIETYRVSALLVSR